MDKFDVVVIGGGPAGASAGIYAARGGLDVCIVHSGASALHKAHKIENYYGAGVVSGSDLYESGLSQAERLGIRIINAQVTFASYTGDFEVNTTAGELCCKRLVIATGAARSTVNIPGIKEFEGKGVSYCAVCDAFFYRKKKVAVLGAGSYAEHEYQTLSRVAASAALLTNGETASFTAPNTYTQKVVRLVGVDGRLSAVLLDDGTELAVDGLFVALGVLGSSGIAKSMGVVTAADGSIVTDGRGMTNVPGLYAAGDCTAGIKQVAKAVSDGLTVGMSIISDLKKGSV